MTPQTPAAARRAEKRAQNAEIAAATGKEPVIASKHGSEATPRAWGSRDVTYPINQPKRPRKTRRPKLPRRLAFDRLKAAVKMYVLLRAKHRTAGMCEVGILCGGENYAVLAYHVIPAATGNAIKYDARNLVGACARCNGAEYFDRKRGTYERWDARHRELLGAELLAELKALAGRKQIGTVEAREMTAEYERKIATGEYK